MIAYSILSITIGAIIGALFRWFLGMSLNSIFPTIPLGTLAANLIGSFLIGIVMAVIRYHAYIPEVVRLGITTGFLGSLTTFSTFSAETVTLLMHQEYLWTAIIICGHVVGSIVATFFGFYFVRIL